MNPFYHFPHVSRFTFHIAIISIGFLSIRCGPLGPESMLAGMPETELHKMFSYGDPTAYAAAIVEGRLLVRTGQHLYCVADQ